MSKILFWNTNRNDVEEIVRFIVRQCSIDIIILAESELDDSHLLERLSRDNEKCYSMAPGIVERLHIYSRFDPKNIEPIHDSYYMAIRHIVNPWHPSFLLVAVHLPSKLYEEEYDQLVMCFGIVKHIERAEENIGHTRTILVGDFNLNPFESAMVGAEGFHAIMDRNIAKKGSRSVKGEKYKYFYNAMWSSLGDESKGPPGTYYYDTGRHLNYYWNTFDQVLIRPELLDYFRYDKLNVLTEINGCSLISKNGIPDNKLGSDHLPVVFEINI
jgi:exonuclease III